MTEVAPWRVISIKVSHGCELVRWLLERAGLPFYEDVHAPFLHVLATLLIRGGVEVPVIVTPNGVWAGLLNQINTIDAHARWGYKIFGETEGERMTNAAFITTIMPLFADAPRQYVYAAVLPNRQVMVPIACAGAPLWERAFVTSLYPLWRILISKGLKINAKTLAAAPGRIHQLTDMVGAELARRESPFLAGAAPGGVDVVIAALMAPLIFPPQYGGRLPPLDAVSPTLRAFILDIRARPAGDLALRTYAACR